MQVIDYIATFFSHFGAIRFQKQCASLGWQAAVRPVPRNLSSSCGTCVFFSTDTLHIFCGGEAAAVKELLTPELEKVVRVGKEGYEELFVAEEE